MILQQHILVVVPITFLISYSTGKPVEEPELIPPNLKPIDFNIRDTVLLQNLSFLHKTVDDYPPEIQELLLADDQDAEVAPGLFEGDIAGLPIEAYLNWRLGLNWQTFPKRRWPNNTVPYFISNKYSSDEKEVIQRAISILNFLTCIKFIPYDGIVKDYILIWPIEKPAGCWSFVGRTGGQQPLSLTPPANRSPKCFGSVGKPIHELLHALGVFHEHSRADRDDHIAIQVDNIMPKFIHNFKKASLINTTQPFQYDYNSIMHYGDKFFSIDRKKPSIITKDASAVIGQRKMLSRIDCLKINHLYGCLSQDPLSRAKFTSFCNDLAL